MRALRLLLLSSSIVILRLSATTQTSTISDDSLSVVIDRIVDEGMNRSQVMQTLGSIVDLHGARLTGSREFKRAALWAREELASRGLLNAHLEGWGPFGRGWSLKRYSAHVISPAISPLSSFPKAWSPGTDGPVAGEAILAVVENDSTLRTLKGRLKGKFLLMSEAPRMNSPFAPLAIREADSTLLELANADTSPSRGRRSYATSPSQRERSLRGYKLMEMAQREGALGILTASRGDGGNVFVQGANVPYHPDTTRANRKPAYSPDAPRVLPQLAVSSEHYNRIMRLLENHQRVSLEVDLAVAWSPVDSGYNVIAEIPGSDLKDEVVMIGAHLDSWHGGTGTTDNGVGVATCMEAMRILKALEIQPRRTIRIALWGGEEQGTIGSRAYVTRHFETKETRGGENSSTDIVLTPAGEKFSVYFNMDNGTGKFRGIYMQGNEHVRPWFRKWLEPFSSLGASTLTLSSTGSTDHASFDRAGLPAFQFIQDRIEYFTRTWHSTMDLYDRALPDDLKQTSIIMAAFAYNAAMTNERVPRKSDSAGDVEESGSGFSGEEDDHTHE